MLISKAIWDLFLCPQEIDCCGRHKLTSPGQRGSLPTSCLLDLSGFCLSTGLGSKVCCKAHLHKLSQKTWRICPAPVRIFHIKHRFYFFTFLS
jgi:hypothetical protein